MLPRLECIPIFGPVPIEVEADLSVFFASFSLDDDGKSPAKAFEDFGHRDLILSRKRLSE